MRSVNPKTGEEWELQGGEWVSVVPPKNPPPPDGAQMQPRNGFEDFARQLGLTARHGIEGLTALPSLMAEPLAAAYNKIPGVDPLQKPSQAVSDLLTSIGLPQPENPAERVVGAASQALSSVGGLAALSSKVPAMLPLAQNLGTQALSATSGAGSAQSAGEMGAPPWAQLGTGLAASVAAPMTAQAVANRANNAWQRMTTPMTGSRQAAEKIVESALKRDMIPPETALNAKALGPEANVIDVAGPNVRQLAQTVTSVPGKAKTVAESVLKNRSNRSVQRMIADARKFMGSDKNAFQSTKSIIETRKNASAPLYKQANESLIETDDTIMAIFHDRPVMQAAFKGAVKKAQNDPDWPANVVIPKKIVPGEPIPLAIMDYTKRALDDKIGAAIRAGKKDDVRILMSLKNNLTSELDSRVPVYKQARDAFSDQSSMLSAMEVGKKILRSEPDEMLDYVASMTASEKEMFVVGAMKTITDKLKSTVDGANSGRRIATELVRERIRPAFKDDASFNNFVQGLERENVFMQTKGILGGSPTQQRLASGSQIAGEVMDIVASPVTKTLDYIRRFVMREKTIPENVRDDIAEILFSESVNKTGTFSSKTVAKLSQYGVSKSKLQTLTDNINAISSVTAQENK